MGGNKDKICELCRQGVQDEIKYGKFMTKGKISVHYYCLLLSSNLIQNGEESQGFLGFLSNDIVQEAKRVKPQICHYCRKNYANVACCAPKCRRTFHLSCGIENGVMSHFTDTFQSFCPRDVKWNKSERPGEDEICLICYEKLGKFNKYFMILSPCCKTGWFHRWCLASFALSAGYFFKCPKCNDTETFREQVVRRGVFIPDQDAAWELESNAFADLLERPSECIAELCVCPNGRNYVESPYALIICQTCGSKAVHKQCMIMESSNFTCNDCSDILKARNLNVKQICDESTNADDGESNDKTEDVEVNITDNAIENAGPDLQEHKIEESNIESDDCSSKTQIHSSVANRKRLIIESDDEIGSNSDIPIAKLIKSKNLRNKTKNNNKNYSDNENEATCENKNSKHVNSDRSPSCSSLESINNALRNRPRRLRARKLSESSNISSSSSSSASSFDLPLRRRVLQKVLSSCESLHRSSPDECETKKSTISVEKNHETSKTTINSSIPDENDEKKQNENKRCSSLGYATDNSPSSADNIKSEAYYNSGKENKKVKRKRSIINERCEYRNTAEFNKSDELDHSWNNERNLRKRKKTKVIPYRLRERSDSISYDDSFADEMSLSNLSKEWSTIFFSPRKSDNKCNTTTGRSRRSRNIKEKFPETDVLSTGQTSIDSFFKRRTTS